MRIPFYYKLTLEVSLISREKSNYKINNEMKLANTHYRMNIFPKNY